MNYSEAFSHATGVSQPYGYQCRLACGPDADLRNETSLRQGAVCTSQLIEIPTGLGKTAGVVLAWLWNRVLHPSKEHRDSWPRRLVYCLPMRTLVEQTRDNVHDWLENLWKHRETLQLPADRIEALRWLSGDGSPEHPSHSPVILMGGEFQNQGEREWDIYPERDAILIGTQDMLLSRALNRGYGMSRYRWPMHFGLLNNDALWIFDEVQLMGSGLPTSAQLEAFRTRLDTAAPCRSWWMSATSERDWLKTVDFDPTTLGLSVTLPEEDLINERVQQLLDAPKCIERAEGGSGDLKTLAKQIVATSERSDGLTLVVVNTVKTARKLHTEVVKLTRKAETEPLLLHSRFRPADRAEKLRLTLAAEGTRRIVISTQVIEAGVDLSAATLFTELAPWSSLVQRFGRCNRRGEISNAGVIWFEPASPAPYTEQKLTAARDRLQAPTLTGVSPNQVRAVPIPAVDRPSSSHVLRRKDLIELFDTTPDLAGNDLDIDRWVREVEDSSVQLFWREWEGGKSGRTPGKSFPQPDRSELCPAPIGEVKDFIKKTGAPVWRWDFLEGDWARVPPEQIYPGQSYLLPREIGGYQSDTGWTPDSKALVPLVTSVEPNTAEETEDDHLSQTGRWQSIAQHTDDVCRELEKLIPAAPPNDAAILRHSARWHDWGKAHDAFQAKLKQEAESERQENLGSEPMAKAPKEKWRSGKLGKKPKENDYRRKYFRHELASALGVLHPETPLPVLGAERDLVAYLIAAHHGKVRLSIRSLPGEWPAPDGIRFARGVWDDDQLPQTLLGGKGDASITAPAVNLSLEPMELGLGENPPFTGLPSWSERMISLRNALGPFRLAFLEALLRAADERGSALASSGVLPESPPDDSARANPKLAGSTARGTASSSSRAGAGERLLEHVDGAGTGKSRVAEGDTRPADATRSFDTELGELTYTEIAEALAARATELQSAIGAGEFKQYPLDESLLALLHRELCGALVPEWAGKWRTIDVTVGAHEPPPFHRVPTALRDYSADLAARWDFLSGEDEELLLETLAFAEGRYLSIHPFRDFNGRIARLWLREILRRAGLPEVRLEVRNTEEKAAYFAALRAADRHDLAPLKAIWRERFAEVA